MVFPPLEDENFLGGVRLLNVVGVTILRDPPLLGPNQVNKGLIIRENSINMTKTNQEEVEETQNVENNTTDSNEDSKEESEESESSESEAEARARESEERINNIKNELIAMREERRELREALEKAKSEKVTYPENGEQPDITKVVESLLQQKEQEKAKENRRKAFEKFVRDNKEYHPENDATGLKRERLENEFSRFNLTGIVETEDFYEYIRKANMLINPNTNSQRQNVNPYPTDPSSIGSSIKTSDPDALSKEEKDLIQKVGWSEEKLKKLKEDDPEYLETLLE